MFICLFLLVFQERSELQNLESRIQVLEHRINPDKISELSNQVQQSDQRFQQERNYVDRELLKLEPRLAQADFLNQKLNWIGIGSLGALIGLLLYLKDLVHRRAKKELGTLLKTNEESLHQLIQSQDRDQELLKSKLLILSEDGHTIQQILRSQGFKSIKVKVVDKREVQTPQEWGEEHYDLVVFDNLSVDFIDHYMAHSHKQVFIGYATQGKPVLVADKARINFANGAMTLFGQVLQTTRYAQHMAEQKAKEAA